jgi:hypothetical protein
MPEFGSKPVKMPGDVDKMSSVRKRRQLTVVGASEHSKERMMDYLLHLQSWIPGVQHIMTSTGQTA